MRRRNGPPEGRREGGGEGPGDAEGIRSFVGLSLDADVRDRLAVLQEDLQPHVRGIRWVPPPALHVTLRFLGQASGEALDSLKEPLARAAAACAPGKARVAGLGFFPDQGRVRVLWMGVELPPAFLEMQAACEAAAVTGGFPGEDRPFRAHLTLGRWRDPALRPALPASDVGYARIDELVLFRSHPSPRGPSYTRVASFRLGEAPA